MQAELSDLERKMIGWLRNEADLWRNNTDRDLTGVRFASALELLLAYGRFHTPAPWSQGSPPGEERACYAESLRYAQHAPEAVAYVEGRAFTHGVPVEHAWCATPGGVVLDPTWDPPGDAYFGICFEAGAAVNLAASHDAALLYYTGPDCPLATWLRGGIGEHLLAPVGRPLT